MSAQYSELYWSTADGLQIATRQWNAPDPIGVILITHGLGDHSGRFERLARFFNDNRFTVLVPDLRGHGRSEGQRGFVRSFDDFLDDMDIAVQQARQLGETLPVLAYGQSFGGLLVLRHAIERRPALAGLVASSPALQIAMRPSAWKVALGRTLGKLFPRISLRTGLDLGELSDDPQTESRAHSDRYLHGRITPRTYFGMLDAGAWCLQHASALSLPALIMHGDRDTITSPAATAEFCKNAPNCQSRVWPGGKHELHNMTQGDEVLDFAAEWMSRQC
jgi:alpha-beta hydrolase superfamily lysophospholipase